MSMKISGRWNSPWSHSMHSHFLRCLTGFLAAPKKSLRMAEGPESLYSIWLPNNRGSKGFG